MSESRRNTILYLTWAIALASVVGSLYFSQILKLEPCVLCWYQRIFMYPIALLLLVGILRQDPKIHTYVLSFSITGLAFSIYHNLLQQGIIPERLAPCTFGVSCVTKDVVWFHFLTIPLLSLIAFVAITVLMVIYAKTQPTK